MAATDAKAVPVKNAAYRVTFPIYDADGDLVTGAASLDSEVSIDGGTFADCTNEATEIATSSGMYYLDLTSSEMNGDTIAIIVKTGTAGAKTTPIVLYTAARSINDLAYPTTSGRSIDVDASGGVEVGSFQAGAITAAAIATDAIDDDAIATGAITSTAFAAGAINAAAIAADAITDAKVASDVTIASVTGSVGSVTGAVGSVTGSVGSVGTGGITTASFAAGAINAAAIAADAIGASELAADAVAEIADAVWDEARAGHVTAGTFGEGVVVNSIANGAVTAAAIATDAIDSDAIAASAVTEIQSGLATSAALATVQADTDDIQTRLPATLVSGRIDASVGAMAANTLTASALASDAVDEIWAKAMTELTTVPGVTGTVLEALEHVFMMLRNKRTETSSVETIYQDDTTTVYATSSKSDDGTTFSSGEVTTA